MRLHEAAESQTTQEVDLMTLGTTLVRRPVLRRPAVASFDRLVADLFRDLGAPRSPLARPVRRPRRLTPEPVDRSFSPRISAEELDNEYRIVAEVPGVEAADLDVNVDDGILVIRGERRYAAAASSEEPVDAVAEEAVEADADAAKADATEGAFVVPSAKFERKLRFPGEIDDAGVCASLKNGVLTVTVPKAEEVKPEVLSIPVETA
jgi:HSP20 family protein